MKKLEIDQMSAVAGGRDLETLKTISWFACGLGVGFAPFSWGASLAIFGPTCFVGLGLAYAG
jgi:hypothetical protein